MIEYQDWGDWKAHASAGGYSRYTYGDTAQEALDNLLEQNVEIIE